MVVSNGNVEFRENGGINSKILLILKLYMISQKQSFKKCRILKSKIWNVNALKIPCGTGAGGI